MVDSLRVAEDHGMGKTDASKDERHPGALVRRKRH
jgi:hypothetical protein